MPLPTKVTTSPIDGIARSVPVLTGGPVTVTVDVEAAKLAAQLDRLDGAISLCNAIRQDREFTSRHHHLSLQRGGAPTEQVGSVYRVIAPFPCLTDGLPFAAGTLVNSSSIGSGMAHRLMVGKRFIEPVGWGRDMASMQSIGRLHIAAIAAKSGEPIRCPNFGQSEPDVSMLAQQVAEWQYPVGRRKTRGIRSSIRPPSFARSRPRACRLAATVSPTWPRANGRCTLWRRMACISRQIWRNFSSFFSPPINFCFDWRRRARNWGRSLLGRDTPPAPI